MIADAPHLSARALQPSHQPSYQPSLQPSAEDTMMALVESQGNAKLAMSILQDRGFSIDMPTLVDVIKDHLPELKQRMEVVAQLELFSFLPIMHKTMVENLSALEPGEAVSAYMKLMELITKSVGTTDINVNINDKRFSQLPRDLQQAYAAYEAAGLLDKVIDHEPQEA